MNRTIHRFQLGQLAVLTGLHFLVDISGGVVPAVLPVIREQFTLSLTQGVILITTLYFSCNLFQVLLGHLRAHKRSVFFIPLGSLLAAAVFLVGLIPLFRFSYITLLVIMVVGGLGVAVTHPESLRALHLLRRVPSALGTAVFMNAGFLGFTAGGIIGASLVQWQGLKGLMLITVPIAAIIFFVFKFRIRLAAEPTQNISIKQPESRVGFWLLFSMAVPLATASTIVPALMPTALNELGYELYFGGMPALMLGLGGIAGSLFWAWLARRFTPVCASLVSALMAAVVLLIYMLFIKYPWAIILLAGTGFGAQGTYTLIVTMARTSPNLVLGRRMGFIVGGTWGLASLILMALGPVAEQFGVLSVLNFTPLGYALAAAVGFVIIIRRRKV